MNFSIYRNTENSLEQKPTRGLACTANTDLSTPNRAGLICFADEFGHVYYVCTVFRNN